MVASAEPPSLVKRRAGPRGLILAVSLALGFGIASFQDSASAAFDGSLQVKGRSATTAGAASSGAIVVADNKNWNKGKGDWNHDKNGNWDKNGYQNWSKYNGKNYGRATITTIGTRTGTSTPMCAAGTTGPIMANSLPASCLALCSPRPEWASFPTRLSHISAGTGPIPTCIAAIGTIATKRGSPLSADRNIGRRLAGALSYRA